MPTALVTMNPTELERLALMRLPVVLGRINQEHKTPATAVFATGLAVVLVLFVLPNLEAAGAAAQV